MSEDEVKQEHTIDEQMQENGDSGLDEPVDTPNDISMNDEASAADARPTKQQSKDRSLKEFLGMMEEYAPIVKQRPKQFLMSRFLMLLQITILD